MAALPYMQLFIADYLADTMHLSTEEHGAYLLLMFNYWQTGRPIPKNRLAKIARMSNDRWISVEDSLREFFSDDGYEWTHERIERDLESVRLSIEQRSMAGKASAAKRSAKKTIEGQRSVNGISTTVKNPLERSYNEKPTNKDKDNKENKDKEILHGDKKNLRARASETSTEEIFISLPLNDGTEFPVPVSLVAELSELYPAVDIHQELRKQRGWLLAETKRRKTSRGIRKFINSWMAKEQDNGGAKRYGNSNFNTGVNHAKPANTGNGESRAMQQFREATGYGLKSSQNMGSNDPNLCGSVDIEEWSETATGLDSGNFTDE